MTSKVTRFKRNCNLYASGDEITVSGFEIAKVISEVQENKACGWDAISVEHLKFASQRLITLLSLCLTKMFLHGHLAKKH